MATHEVYLRWLADEIAAGHIPPDVPVAPPPPAPPPPAPPPVITRVPLGVTLPAGWSLKFAEEFDGPLSVAQQGSSTIKWTDHLWYVNDWHTDHNHWPSGDLSVPLASVFPCANSVCTISTRKLPDGTWVGSTLCSVNSQGAGFSQQYGYFEAKLKFPKGNGNWPAFWLYSVARVKNGTAHAAELDIVEWLGNKPSHYWTTWHDFSTGTHLQNGSTSEHDAGVDLTLDWHTWGFYWDTLDIKWYLDGKLVLADKTRPDHNTPMFITLNLALGGWGGNAVDANTPNPSPMLADYVRVWGI